MFISMCNLSNGRVLATKHHIKMSPQFEGWYNTLTPEEKKEVSLSVYAFFYGVLTGDIDWQSESANINLGYNFTEIKQSPQFIRWYNKLKDPQTVELVRRRNNITLQEWNHDADHVHILFKGHPNTEISKFINAYKSASSRLLKKEFPQIRQKLWKEYFWSRSFCLLTTGGAPIEIVRKYIESQGIE